ncbi:unnamed protein product [Phytophthora fragariaefolia]|uniref:Unnamed protein product n=1 Tax=Phytophthora fragariaefolia TaxID=1490495 RepID=A0A9W6Y9R9_9STRA|nr:unnamed protein product [Phytophthora fragariaefolia]
MSPQVSTPVVAEVVDTPAPSVIEPVEASNIEVSKVPQLDDSIVAPAVTENVREFERARQAEEYAEYADASQNDVTPPSIEIVNPTKPKATTKIDKYTKVITSEDEIKETILKKIVNDMMLLDTDLIRESNKVDPYDLSSLRNVTIDVSKLALLIRQTLVRTDNNGLPMWYGKNNT